MVCEYVLLPIVDICVILYCIRIKRCFNEYAMYCCLQRLLSPASWLSVNPSGVS